jgi:hypothetical protein
MAWLRKIWWGLLIVLGAMTRLPRILLKTFLVVISIVLTIVFAVAGVEILWVSPRDIAYRYVSPAPHDRLNACDDQQRQPELLAVHANSEESAERETHKKAGLECMLQFHSVPVQPNQTWYKSDRPMGPIAYYLSFIEFQENGRLAEVGLDGSTLKQSQLEILEDHLSKQKNNFVLVFIHGWRHDARIGDDNVGNARVYAAHAASALDYRCKTTGNDCGYTVTAVFVGWRGARVDERRIEAWADRNFSIFGKTVPKILKAVFADFPAALTLFDRKPVSERIAPSVVASLRRVDRLLKKRTSSGSQYDRMIVIGHSLGGNILATGLISSMIDLVRTHKPGDLLQSPLGNLVVLLNPAAEAWKWTSIQREMRLHVHFPEDTTDVDPQAKAGLNFYPPNQPPVYISITSAFSWPAAALTRNELDSLPQRRDPDTDEMVSLAQYDSATHDAFPLFKGNFQPLAQTLVRLAAWFPTSKPGQGTFFPDRSACGSWETFAKICVSAVTHVLKSTAAFAPNIPFTNQATDDTLTIGNLDPSRPPYDGHVNPPRHPYDGFKSPTPQSPLPFGTTSELIVNNHIGHPTLYTNAGSAYLSECAMLDHWLWQARHNPKLGPYEGWDSGFSHTQGGLVTPDADTPNLTPIRPRARTRDGHLEIQFRQYLLKSGTQSIITSDDPMWNIRAFDTTLAFHGGYVSYPLICALNQLVMDDVASEPKN